MLYVMATKATTEEIRFIVDVKPNQYTSGRLDATVIPVVLENGKIRNCQYNSLGDRGSDYADLKIEGWIERTSTEADFYYGYDPIEFREVWSITLARAESMAKTLRRLNRRIEALYAKHGRPTDYAGFLHYLALAAGVKERNCFARKVAGGGWDYDSNEYRWMDVDQLRYHLASKIREYKGEE